MKIEIGRTDAGFDVRVDGSFDGRIVTGMSTHETACDAAREAAGLLRVWATTEGDCKPMKSLWLVTGVSETSDGFAHVVSADDRVGAVGVLAEKLGMAWTTSRDAGGVVRAIIVSPGNYPRACEWMKADKFWRISCSPIEFGVNMIDEEAWEWDEDLEALAKEDMEREGG